MDTIDEERPMSASVSSKKSSSNLDAPFADHAYILRDRDLNL